MISNGYENLKLISLHRSENLKNLVQTNLMGCLICCDVGLFSVYCLKNYTKVDKINVY